MHGPTEHERLSGREAWPAVADADAAAARLARAALSRRQVLRAALVLGSGGLVSALLAACGGNGTATATTGTTGAATNAAVPPTTGATAGPTGTTAAAATPAGGAVTGSPSAVASPTTAAIASPVGSPAGSPAAGSYPPIATGPKYTASASITVWGFGTEPTNPLAFTRFDAFQKAYPNIKVDHVSKIDNQKILTAAASKTLPDILWLGRSDMASWESRGVLRAADDYIKRDNFDTSRFYKSALDEVTFDNKVYGIPQFTTVRALYVNTDDLKAAGTDPNSLDAGNWDQLTTLAGKLVKKNGQQIQRWGFNHKIQDGWLWLWGLANGGTFISDDLKKVSYNDPKIVEALDWGVKDFDAQGGYQAFQAFSTSSPVWTANEEFARDLVSLTVYENWMLGLIAQTVPERNFVVMPVLKRNGSKDDWISFATGQAWCMTSGVKNADAAWEFIKFMCEESTWLIGANGTKDYQKKNNKPYIPTLTSDKIADQLQITQVYEPIAPKFDNAIKLFAALQDKSQPIPVSRSPVSTQLQDDLNNLAAKPALNHETSAQDGLNRANQKAQQDIDSFRP